ncbi:MAG: DsbA family protein, partial [Arenicella sp.]|nr:DsbA family protein [Arenicella sp.]
RWITSKMMSRMASEHAQIGARNMAERKRVKLSLPHTVEYFHQVDDGYSHLAVQLLKEFSERYRVELHCYLVSESAGDNLPEPELLSKLSCYDARIIAPYYDLQPPGDNGVAPAELVAQTTAILAGLSNEDFIEHAAVINSAMWQQDEAALVEFAQRLGGADEANTNAALHRGNARRKQLKHYSGAMFFYGDEWYWGIDRFYHLERRLAELGLDKSSGQPPLAPSMEVVSGPLKDQGQLTLEIFPSLRSPYTAIAFDRAVRLAEETGVELKVRPVLPMVMRGVPATMEKGRYILFDTGREARAAGVPFGPCYDPIGEPTRRAYSLYAWACEQGKGVEFISTFLRCAWTEAINTNNDKGLNQVVTRAGLDWAQAEKLVGNPDWQEQLERNRLAMYEHGLWGVPSFRLIDAGGKTLLALWGQDRLWVVAAEIQKALQAES